MEPLCIMFLQNFRSLSRRHFIIHSQRLPSTASPYLELMTSEAVNRFLWNPSRQIVDLWRTQMDLAIWYSQWWSISGRTKHSPPKTQEITTAKFATNHVRILSHECVVVVGVRVTKYVFFGCVFCKILWGGKQGKRVTLSWTRMRFPWRRLDVWTSWQTLDCPWCKNRFEEQHGPQILIVARMTLWPWAAYGGRSGAAQAYRRPWHHSTASNIISGS